ncbi:acyl-CoA thioesterase [Chelatococcus reniformis]|uniref:Acyl-CoA thioesterase n=1 Tax=Chelatococcus reniformis TaxID=1494448 RepID=A0A916X8I4_9HYPH|nr:thioesterase family protein [Chelatococcus reniformis]GGC50362.1 acyl-CoA thioesterase [Chelatococcus reniformis]
MSLTEPTPVDLDRPAAGVPHPLDAATQLTARPDGSYEGHTSTAYWNFTGPFGGVTAACLMRALLDHPRRQGSPVSLTVNYCAPVAEGAFRITPRLARTNRSTQHWSLEITQDGEPPSTTATAVFGARPETFAHAPATPPALPPRESLVPFPSHLAGSAWLRNYDFRFAQLQPLGRVPRVEPLPAAQELWIADAPPRPLDFVALAALADTFFARIFVVRGALVPAGTVSMSIFFHATEADLTRQGSEPLRARADSRVFDRGFHDQSAELWGADGTLFVSTHQIVYYRDPPAA